MPPELVLDPAAATDEMLRLVHTAEYVERFTRGGLSETRCGGSAFPGRPALVERSRRAVGGTMRRRVMRSTTGTAMNLAGGTHHAFPDHGEGFCVFNDVADRHSPAAREGAIRRVAVIDLDVHQGNGTHAIFADDDASSPSACTAGGTIRSRRWPARSTSSSRTAPRTPSISAPRGGAAARAARGPTGSRAVSRRGGPARGRSSRPHVADVRGARAARRDGAPVVSRGGTAGGGRHRGRIWPADRGHGGGPCRDGANRRGERLTGGLAAAELATRLGSSS